MEEGVLFEDVLNVDMTPQDVAKGKDTIYKVPGGVAISTPSYIVVPDNNKVEFAKIVGHEVDKLNVIKVELTNKTCPWGEGLKHYFLEHGFSMLCTPKGFQWLSDPNHGEAKTKKKI